MHFIFPTAASSLSLLTMQRVCYNWLEQIYWIGMRRYYRSRVCVCVLLIFLIFIFSENECSKPLMYLIYVNRTRLNMLRSIWFRKINIFLYIVAFWQHLVVILLAWLILCIRQCSCYASQSIPAAPSPPPPLRLLRGICPPCQSRGWGICKFCTARGPGICQPRGH